MPIESPPDSSDARDGIDTRRIAAELRARMFGAAPDPIRIGRYVVLDRLGAGAMGVVYSAFDPELDRRIAIKLVAGDDSPTARNRLIREAQAIARISHPNVVGVYDVGEYGSQVYVAMELVRGQTLRAWMSERHPWREVVARFVAAARGLAAAHDGGVIHRDFKPDNVLLGARGEVKVVDFGLALAGPSTDDDEDAHTDGDDVVTSPMVPTSHGGTPAYMSPEQFEGAPLDARSDQFGFCVALFEALWGRRPFAGTTVFAIRDAVLAGRIESPPPGEVPRWLEAVVRRGLADDPVDRWPSMHAIAELLGRDPARTLRVRLALGAGLGAAAALGAFVRDRGGADDPCLAADSHLRASWSTDRADALLASWRADPRPYAADVAHSAGARLERWADEWSAMARDNCEATHVRGEQSSALLDMRTGCLRDRAANFVALVEVFERDPDAIERAPRAIAELPGVAPCGDVEAVQARFPPPRDPEAVAALRDDLASLRSRAIAHPDDDVRADLPVLVERASALAHPPVLLEALLLQARHASDARVRQDSFDRAYWIAAAIHDDAGELESALGIAHVAGTVREQFEIGRQWLRHARAAAFRGHAPLYRMARIDGTEGTIALRSGALAEAIVHHSVALALVDGDATADPLLVGSALVNLAASYNTFGVPERAAPLLERALAIEREIYGAAHPELAGILVDLGNVAHARDDFASARAHFEQAVTLLEHVTPDAEELGMALANLAVVLAAQGDDAGAVARLRQALALFERTLGPDHLYVASTLGNLAQHLPPPEARAAIERAIAIYQRQPGHPGIGYAYNQLADLHNTEGRPDLALAPARQALAVREAALSADDPNVAWSAHVLGDTLRALGRIDEAIPLLERALAIREGLEGGARLAARTRFVLGTALWESGARARARALIDAADPVLRAAESSGDRTFVVRLDEWRAAHPAPR